MLLDLTRQALQQLAVAPNAKLVVAVSGGADSLCLLHLLARLQPTWPLLLHVAHLDHGLRGVESTADAAFVAATATALGLPATIGRRDVATLARRQQQGTQAAARSARYAFLAETVLAVGADALAVAHNANDQAETLLLHLVRGAGPQGLRGMRPAVPWHEWAHAESRPRPDRDLSRETRDLRPATSPRPEPEGAASTASGSPPLLRPLLAVPRATIDAYCAAHGLRPRNDPSNRSPKYTRSRLRHELLPALETYNSQIVAALSRSAAICADDFDFVQAQLDACWPTLAHVEGQAVRLDREAFAALHPALRRYGLRRAAETLNGPGTSLAFEHVEAACSTALGAVGSRLGLPGGLWLEVTHGAIALSLGPLLPPAGFPALPTTPVPLPQLGQVRIGPWLVRLAPEIAPPGPWATTLDAATLAAPLTLRRRQAGDRLRPLGGRGSRRLQDLFVDRKVPREQRDGWPLLTCGNQIAWVVGLAVDERFAAGSTTRTPLGITLTHDPEQNEG